MWLRAGEKQVVKWTAEGAVKGVVIHNLTPLSILQRVGIRQLPRICRYPAKCMGFSMNQGGTADCDDSSLTEGIFLSRIFYAIGNGMAFYEGGFKRC